MIKIIPSDCPRDFGIKKICRTSGRPGVETTNGNPDIKETFAWGQGLLRGSISTWYHGPNLIPEDLDQLQEVFDIYCSKMKEFGLRLLQAFEDAFDIHGYLLNKFSQEMDVSKCLTFITHKL